MGYRNIALRGVFWIGGYRGLSRVISLARTALLARLLTPGDFGLVTIAAMLLTLLEIFTETGINTILIQLKEKVNDYINTAWTVSIIRGLIISLVLYLAAPLAANFFNAQASLDIIRTIALVPLIRGLINPAEVVFQKELLFKKEFLFRSFLFFIDATVAVITAFLTRSPYSVVYGLIAGAIAEVIISHILISPHPRVSFNKTRFAFILTRGKWMTLSGIFDYLFQNSDNIAVGRFLGTAPLGIYGNVYQLSTAPVSEVSNILSKVTFPIFMKMSEDKKSLWSAYKKTLTGVFLTSMPIAIILFLFPEVIIHYVLGDQWLAGAPVIRILGFLGVIRSVALTSYAIFLAHHKQQYVTYVAATGALVMLALLPILIPTYGLNGAALSALIGASAAALVSFILCRRI